MLEKRFTEMDMVLMEMQKHENDKFILVFNYHEKTVKEALERAMKTIQEYIDNHKEDDDTESSYGFSINLELFEKGKPKKMF